jgi:hypothetical protein
MNINYDIIDNYDDLLLFLILIYKNSLTSTI